MTLQDAVDIQIFEQPNKRIIRQPNNTGWCDLWFEFDMRTRKLVVKSWEFSTAGMYIRKAVAPFQSSPHEDWILV